jgi:hypothetical protein
MRCETRLSPVRLAGAAGVLTFAAVAASVPGPAATAGATASATASTAQTPTTQSCYVPHDNITMCMYLSVGKPETFKVPWWVDQVTIDALGAYGAPGFGAGAAAGGRPAEVTSVVPVASGSELEIRVGGTPLTGSGQGGWNGGGTSYGGGGGGASEVRNGSFTLAERVVVAGGGGGGGTVGWKVVDPGTPGNGGDAGLVGAQGQNGSNSPFTAGGGFGGSRTDAGAGGGASSGMAWGGCPTLFPSPAFAFPGGSGSNYIGGGGGYLTVASTTCLGAGGYGGGGGGGFRGGGGGGGGVNAGAGGGGGSSYGTPGATQYAQGDAARGRRAFVGVMVEAPVGWESTGVTTPTTRPRYDAPVTATAWRTGEGKQRAQVFVLDDKGAALTQTWDPGTQRSLTDAVSLGGIFHPGSGLAAVSWGPDRIDVVGRARDSGLFHNVWNGVGWAGWRRLTADGTATSSPTITSWGPGRLDVFVRNQDGQLTHGGSDNGGVGWQWETWAGHLEGDPAAVSWGPGRIDVFSAAAASSAAVLQHQWWDGVSWSGWHEWHDADILGMRSAPTVASAGSGQLDLFYRDSTGHIVQRQYGNGGWSAWTDAGEVPSRLSEPVAAVSLAGSTRWVLARGELDNALWEKRLP